MIHTVPKYLIQPQHPVTINLVGCGGTGSQMLTRLASIDHALRAGGLGLGPHMGLHVRAWDGDEVSPSNIGRQNFFPSDVGHNKAVVLVTRINRAYGLGWIAEPKHYTAAAVAAGDHAVNILITCVDSGQTRVDIAGFQKPWKPKAEQKKFDEDEADDPIENVHAYQRQYYWMDLGNSRTSGQVVLGTLNGISQPKMDPLPIDRMIPHVATLPTIVDLFPDLAKEDEEDRGPSCSMAEALFHQDLCVNSMLAEWGKKLLWNIFKTMRLTHHGVYVNLDTLTVNPIPIYGRIRKTKHVLSKAGGTEKKKRGKSSGRKQSASKKRDPRKGRGSKKQDKNTRRRRS